MSPRDLLEAERALGRLVEALSRDGARELWRSDALRREALASAELDGQKVDWEDLVVAQIDPMLLGQGLRPSTQAPLRLIAAAEAIDHGFRPRPKLRFSQGRSELAGSEVSEDDATAGNTVAELLAATRKAAADLDAFMAGGALSSGKEEIEDSIVPSAGSVLPPLSAGWLEAAWSILCPDHPPLPSADTLATLIDDALTAYGLAGVSAAMRSLDRHGDFPTPTMPDYTGIAFDDDFRRRLVQAHADNQPTDVRFAFIRLLTPALIQRACSLPFAGPWLSPALHHARGLQVARAGNGTDWAAWIYPAISTGFSAERQRLARLLAIHDSWLTKFSAKKRRWSASRSTLSMLIAYPAVTTRWLERNRGISRRAAQMLVAELCDASIIRHVTAARGRDWYIADEVRHKP